MIWSKRVIVIDEGIKDQFFLGCLDFVGGSKGVFNKG